MNTSFGSLLVASLVTIVAVSFAVAPIAEAARGGGGGGGGGGGAGARAGGGGGGGARQSAHIDNSRADVRSNNVRSTSVNNVNVDRNVNVNVQGGGGCCHGGWDHPVAAAAVVPSAVAVTAAAVGSIAAAPPPNCMPVNSGGRIYQQCGGVWYAPQGPQYVVVNPPY